MSTDRAAVALLRALHERDRLNPPLIDAAFVANARATVDDVFATAEGAERNAKAQPDETRREHFAGLVVGAVAEEEFTQRYTHVMKGQEFVFADKTKEGTDTDFLTLDGRARAAFRINVKAHGTLWQKAWTYVRLEPEDTFALATYKVRQAYRKSQQEALPFLFAIVSSEKLRADAVAEALPSEIALIMDTSSLYVGLKGWKTVEDRLVAYVLDPAGYGTSALIQALRKAAAEANWRVISAIKANHLMNELLDQRVPAVSKPGAPRTQPNMHFSLSGDMVGLDDLLVMLRDYGIQHVATKIAYHEI